MAARVMSNGEIYGVKLARKKLKMGNWVAQKHMLSRKG
jgi:hypothetical protein